MPQAQPTKASQLITVALLLALAVAMTIWTAKSNTAHSGGSPLPTSTSSQWYRICLPIPTGPAPTYTPDPTPTCYPAFTPYPTSTPYPPQPDNPGLPRATYTPELHTP